MAETPPPSPSEQKHPGIEVLWDDRKNLKFTFPATPLRETALHGEQHAAAIVTPEGLALLKNEGINREDILRRVADHRLTTAFRKVGSGGADGIIREVSSAQNQFDRLFKKGHITAVQKDLVDEGRRGGVKAKGWELVELFDVIRPAFDKHGFKIIRLYGATDNQVFMPRLGGEKLMEVAERIQNKGNEEGMLFEASLEEETIALYEDALEAIRIYMEQRGFLLDPEWSWDLHNETGTSPSFITDSERVNINLDFAARKANRRINWEHGSTPANFDSWMVDTPEISSEIVALSQQGNIKQALGMLKEHTICYDPLFVRKYDRRDDSSQEIVLQQPKP